MTAVPEKIQVTVVVDITRCEIPDSKCFTLPTDFGNNVFQYKNKFLIVLNLSVHKIFEDKYRDLQT